MGGRDKSGYQNFWAFLVNIKMKDVSLITPAD